MIIDTRKAKLEFFPDCVVKTLKTTTLDDKWFDYYSSLQKNNDLLVKVYDVKDRKTIIMERLNEETSLEVMLKDKEYLKNLSKFDLIDIVASFNHAFMCGIEFSKTISKYFYHTDLHLYNIIFTKEKKIKVIDPDSFQICNGLDHSYRFYQSNIFLMHAVQKHRYINEGAYE